MTLRLGADVPFVLPSAEGCVAKLLCRCCALVVEARCWGLENVAC